MATEDYGVKLVLLVYIITSHYNETLTDSTDLEKARHLLEF